MEKSIGLKRWKIHRFLIAKDNLWKLDMQDDIMRSGFINSDRFVICIYYECRYAQFALSSVIELPRIPAYYPKTTLLELPIPVKALFRPVLMPPIIGLLTIRKAKKLTN